MNTFIAHRRQPNGPSSIDKRETRMVFRVLAAILAAIFLVISLPLALSGAVTNTWWESWLFAICSLYAGIGLALGARTGRWYGGLG